MPNSNEDDLSTLIGLGIITVIGYGVYKILKSTKSFTEGQRIKETQIDKFASEALTQPSYPSYSSSSYDDSKKYEHCPVCRKVTQQCDDLSHSEKTRCIPCNGDDYYAYQGRCEPCGRAWDD